MIKFHQAQNRHIESIIIARLRRKRLGKIPLDRDSNPRPCAPSFWPRWFVVALASDASGFGLPASPAPWCSSWVVGCMHRDLAVAFLGFGVTKPNPVLHIHLNSTGPTARLTARRYRARLKMGKFTNPKVDKSKAEKSKSSLIQKLTNPPPTRVFTRVSEFLWECCYHQQLDHLIKSLYFRSGPATTTSCTTSGSRSVVRWIKDWRRSRMTRSGCPPAGLASTGST